MEGFSGTEASPRSPFGIRGFFASARLKEKLVPLAQVHELHARARNAGGQSLLEALLAELRARPSFAESELAHPETPVLFGAVSISGRYTRASRELIVRFFESRDSGDDLSPFVQPRRPFRAGRIRSWDCRSICQAMKEVDAIADPIADLENDGKGIPVLIKHYSRLGGKLLGFTVDSKFSNVLDGLVVLDLRKTRPSTLERYMGQSGLAAFRRYHGLPVLQERH